jgi:DNA invertase Pin-like site-specific DNA recombinase
MLHLYAALAEKERAMISTRTKAALAAAKERGTRLGNPRLADVRAKGSARNRAKAIESDAKALPVIRTMQAEGASFRKIAGELNARGIATARGGTWAATQVSDIVKQAA